MSSNIININLNVYNDNNLISISTLHSKVLENSNVHSSILISQIFTIYFPRAYSRHLVILYTDNLTE